MPYHPRRATRRVTWCAPSATTVSSTSCWPTYSLAPWTSPCAQSTSPARWPRAPWRHTCSCSPPSPRLCTDAMSASSSGDRIHWCLCWTTCLIRVDSWNTCIAIALLKDRLEKLWQFLFLTLSWLVYDRLIWSFYNVFTYVFLTRRYHSNTQLLLLKHHLFCLFRCKQNDNFCAWVLQTTTSSLIL